MEITEALQIVEEAVNNWTGELPDDYRNNSEEINKAFAKVKEMAMLADALTVKLRYTYDGVPIPLGGELFYRCRATKRFYILFAKSHTEPTRGKVYVGENEEMADTRQKLNEIWEKYGEDES